MSIRIYAFHSGGEVVPASLTDPFDEKAGTTMYIPWFFYLVTHPQGNLLFDAGVHPEMIRDPRSRVGAWADGLDMRATDGDDVASRLATVNLAPEDIDAVILSHLHFDHVSALDLFRHAKIYAQRTELAFARNPPVYQAGPYNASDFEGEYQWQTVDGFHDVFGDGRVEIIPTPGHTPGHQSLLVKAEHSTVLLVADAAYDMEKMRQRRLPAVLWSPDAVVSSWNLIEWLAERENAVVLASHDPAYETAVRMAPNEWYE